MDNNKNIDRKNKWAKRLWWTAGILGFFGISLFVFNSADPEPLYASIGALLIMFSLIIVAINTTYYNIIPFLLSLVILAMFFKFMHWPGASILLIISSGILGVISIMVAFKYLKNSNSFLKWIGFSSNIILPIMFFALLFKIQHWPGGSVIGNIGTFLFVILIFAMVFTLPNSKYIEWSKLDKKSFYRSIIIPLFFIFTLTTMDFIANDTLQYILGKPKHSSETAIPFEMNDVTIIPHEGIIK